MCSPIGLTELAIFTSWKKRMGQNCLQRHWQHCENLSGVARIGMALRAEHCSAQGDADKCEHENPRDTNIGQAPAVKVAGRFSLICAISSNASSSVR